MNLQTYTYDNPITIKFGQGTLQTAYTYTWMGDILEEVAIIPNAPSTLISMYAIATKGLTVSLNTKRITITDEFTGKTIYNRYVDKPGLYYIDLTKFITIRAPKHLDTYSHLSAHARTIQRAIAFDDDENEEQLTATPQNHHTCLLNLSQQEPPLSDITPTQKRKTHTRIPTSTLKRILWLHKSTGHRGREALAQMVETMTNAGEGVTAETVRRVYDHIQCTACELAKRNKATRKEGSGIYNDNPGHTISIDYIGKITPTSARGHTGQFIAEDRATNYLHEQPTKSKDADHLINFLTNVLTFYRHHKWEVRELRTDKGSVEISEHVRQFLNNQNPPITIISAAPRQQNQNPWERTAQTMIKGTGAIMSDQYTLGPTYWDYATAFWVKGHNATPNDKTEGASPVEMVTGVKPDAERDFKFPFGCPVTITNIKGREGNTYDTVNDFGIAIGSSDNGNGATKVIINGKESRPYFERLHVLPLKLYNRKITNEERQTLQPTYEITPHEITATYKSPVTTNLHHPQEEPIPGSTLGNAIIDTATSMPTHPPPYQHPLIGATVTKQFGDAGTFTGEITEKVGNWYHIVYDDGDEEDMSIREVEKTITDKRRLEGLPTTRQAAHKANNAATTVDTQAYDSTDTDTNTIAQACYIADIEHLYYTPDTHTAMAAKRVHTESNPTVGQARKSEDWPKWKKAIHDEIIGNLEAKNTYTRIDRSQIPRGTAILHTKVDLKVKYDSTNTYVKHKARLCILGNTEPVDGRDDYASTANGKLIGLLFAIAAHENLRLSGLDIEGAFLTADIDEDIYICIKGDLLDESQDIYAKLNKSLYGLRRSPQLFQKELQLHITSAGYTQSPDDQALYFKRGPREEDVIFFLTHVDDFAIASSSDKLRDELYAALRQKYKIEVNNLEHFIGINIAYDDIDGDTYMTIGQPAHADKIALFFNIKEPFTTPQTPMSTTYLNPKDKNPETNPLYRPTCQDRYRQGIGLLLYILKTKQTTAFAINILCTKTSDPREADWEALVRVGKYIVGTKHQRLRFKVNDKKSRLQALEIIGYADASTACHEDGRPHTGFGFSLSEGGPLFYARSHKQPLVTLSSCEAELTATIDATCDIIWYRNILNSLGYTQDKPTTLYGDNASTITLGTAYSGNHKRVRQFTRNVHWMIQNVQNGTVKLAHIAGTANIADALTKPLGPSQFIPHAHQMLGITKHAYSTTIVLPIATPHLTASEANDIWDSIHPGLKAGWQTYISPTQRIRFKHKIAYQIIYSAHDTPTHVDKYTHKQK